MSKPRIKYSHTQKLYHCYLPSLGEHAVFTIGIGITPEDAYYEYIKSEAKVAEIQQQWHKYQPRPETLVNITYVDPKEMEKGYST